MNPELEKVIDKVKKLLSLTNSSNPNEAAAAASAAARIIQEHNLTEAQLEASGQVAKEAVERDDAPFAVWAEKRVPQWQRKLAWGLIGLYDCAGIGTNMRGRPSWEKAFIRIIGRRSDMEAARYMFAYLTLEIERLAQLNRGNGRRWLDSFRHGAVSGCLQAMREAKDMAKKQANEDLAKGAAIVLVNARRDEALSVLHTLYPKRSTSHGIGQRGGSGFVKGHQAGRTLGNQPKQLDASSKRLLKA